jgi:hypothetical protein
MHMMNLPTGTEEERRPECVRMSRRWSAACAVDDVGANPGRPALQTAIVIKGLLFLAVASTAAALILLEVPSFRVAILLALLMVRLPFSSRRKAA